jgi:hypothetical protein
LKNVIAFTREYHRFRFVVKLHPSMSKQKWMNDLENEHLVFYSFDELSMFDFLRTSNMILVGNSGLGFEAVINSVPVAVIKIDPASRANDYIMVEAGNFPDVTLYGDFENLMLSIEESENRKLLLENEERFVHEEYYYAIGEDAVANAIELIDDKINS